MTAQTVLKQILAGDKIVAHIGCAVVLPRPVYDDQMVLINNQKAEIERLRKIIQDEANEHKRFSKQMHMATYASPSNISSHFANRHGMLKKALNNE